MGVPFLEVQPFLDLTQRTRIFLILIRMNLCGIQSRLDFTQLILLCVFIDILPHGRPGLVWVLKHQYTHLPLRGALFNAFPRTHPGFLRWNQSFLLTNTYTHTFKFISLLYSH